MMLRADFLAMLSLAAGAHLALFTLVPLPGGGGAGAGGQNALSMQPASAAIRAEVAKWDRPPEATPTVKAAQPVKVSEAQPSLPRTDTTIRAVETPALAVTSAPEKAPTLPDSSLARLPRPDLRSPTPSLPAPTSAPDREAPMPLTLPDTRTAAFTPEPLPDFAPAGTSRPKVRPKPDEPVPARVARGNGGGLQAGTALKPKAATGPSAAERSAAQAEWASAIQSRIARQQAYPRGTRATGRVRVEMTVLASGALGNVGLAASSGEAALDRAALQAVRRAAPFPPAPKVLTDDWFAVSQWITFERR